MTDHNKAMRLADEVRVVADRLQYTPGGFYGVETVGPLNQAAALLRQLSAERDQLRAEVERYHHLRNGQSWPAVFASHDAPEPLRGEDLDAALDHARTTHKETE